jgi:hypothetical protein
VKIKLDAATHTYTNTKNEKYKSVSSLIEQFVPFFDFEQKSYDYSIKYNIPVEEVRKDWREKNKNSTVFGKQIHSNIEKLIKEENYSHKEKIYDQIGQQIKTFSKKGTKLLTEEIVYCDEFKIAGMSDLIVDRKNDFDIIDFKTNKKIKFENSFDEKFLLYPLNYLPNAEYFKYALQLSLYGLMYEKMYDKRLYRLVMFWFKRKSPEDYTCLNGTWVKYSLPFLKEEAKLLLEYGSGK